MQPTPKAFGVADFVFVRRKTRDVGSHLLRRQQFGRLHCDSRWERRLLSGFHTAGEDRVAGELEASVDALLLGSHTYEFALKLGQWPSPNKLSWVFTRRDL